MMKFSIPALRKILILLASTSVCLSSISVKASEFDPSWSLNFSIEPKATRISNHLVSEVNPELTHIELLSCDNKTLSKQQCQQIQNSAGQLTMLVDANHDGVFERWSIAVGKLKDGKYAKVLLVQDESSGRILQALLVESPNAGFSALYFQQGKILWGMCLSCDVLADIVWDEGAYSVSWQPSFHTQEPEELLVDNG